MFQINQEDIELLEKDDDIQELVEGITDEDVKKQLQTEAARKVHFRTKFGKEKEAKEVAEARIVELEKLVEKPGETPSTDVETNTNARIDEIDAKVELRMDGYSREEISFIERNRAEGKSLAETAEDSFVKKAIDGIREDKKVEDGTPAPSSTSQRVDTKTLEKMSPAEKDTLLAGVLKGKK